MAKAFRYQHLRSLVADKVPSAEDIREGEIAVNLAAGKEKMFLKNTNNVVIKFITEEQVDAKIASSGSGLVDNKIEALSGAIDTNTSDIINLNSNKFGNVSYDSNTKKINFYDTSSSSNLLGYIDATDFINGGVDNVDVEVISGKSYLVITFTSGSGKEPIYLPVSDIFDADNYYTKNEIDGKLVLKVNVSAFEAEVQRATAAESALSSGKADKATTLSGYGITDAYTKSQTYTKTEVNGLVSTPHQNYVTVATYASLPASGSTDTIYRVSNWDGSANSGAGAVDVTIYSEYAWDGTQYIFLCVKSQIGEVFDITVYNNNAKYDTLADALGANGANVPQSIRKGGMSVKYVQNSDNKYAQYRYMGTDTTSTLNTFLDIANWQGVDDVLTPGSNNLITSGEVYRIKRKVDEHSTMLRTTEENGAYFTDGNGNVFMQYEDETGFDVANPSESFKNKINGNLQTELQETKTELQETKTELQETKTELQETKTKLSNLSKGTEETGAYFTDGNGNVFMQYEDETGFDVAKISQSFKDKLGGGTGRNNIVRDIEEDVISLVTDEAGNSAVNWSNEHGLDANKVSYHLAKSIQGRQIKDMQEWRDLAVGMFIHWGVYSVLAGHYQGVDIDGQIIDYQSTIIAEWIMKQARIPKATYQAYQSQFTTNGWNADAIAKLAYDCGMKYIVITAKHHEGFALYNSQIIPWNISTSGAVGKDPMQELKNACEKYGIKFCIYYSVGRDWTAEGGFDQEWTNNNVDPYTDTQHKAYMTSCANALKEIVDRYDPYIIWYDGYINTSLNEIVYDAQKNYYPQVVVNDRLCHNPAKGDYATGEGAYYQGDRSEWPNAENCYCVMKNSWGYNENQDTPEYANSLYELLCKEILESRARTQNSLINIGPKGDGSVSVNAINVLNSLAGFVNKYGSFENTRGLNYYTFPNWGRAIMKGRTLRCYVWGGNTTILVDGVYTKPIKSVKVWDIQDPESVNNYTIVSDYRLRVTNIPVNAQHPSVVDIEFGNDIVFEEYSTIIDGDNVIIGASSFQAHGNMYLINFASGVQFGGWTQSGSVTSTFRYDGVSGNYAIKLYIPHKSSNGIPITIKITDLSNNSTTTLTATSDETITQENVYLTNGTNYEVEISKTSTEWFNLSHIEFI